MKAFLSYYNTEKIEVSPYHPASNGLAEVINRSINRLLRIYTNQYATADWDLLLPVIQHTINNTYNRMIRETPFFALFGYDSAAVTLSQPKLSYSEDRLTQHMSRVAAVRQHCRENLLAAQSAYTSYTNEGRQEKTIKVGQRVFAKVIKHRQGLHRKLDLPVSGPFKVIGRQGRSFRLKELATNQLFTVHPDYIIVRTRGVQYTESPSLAAGQQCEDSESDDEQKAATTKPVPAQSVSAELPAVQVEATPSVPPPSNSVARVQTPAKPVIRVQPPRRCKQPSSVSA